MKVLFISEFFTPFIHGGGEISTFKLAKGLVKRGVEVDILTPNYGASNFEEIDGVKIFRFSFYKRLKTKSDSLTNIWYANPIFFLYLSLLIIKHVRKNHVSLIHVHSRFSIPSTVVASKILGVPVVGTFRDWQLLCNYAVCLTGNSTGKTCHLWEYFTVDFPKYYKDKVIKKNPLVLFSQICFAIYGRCQRNVLKFFAQRVTTGVCISKFQQELYYKNGFSNLKVIYNPEEFGGRLTNKIKLKTNILFQGRITDGKGVRILLDAFKIVTKKYPQYQLVLAGRGSVEKFYKKARDLGIDKSVNFIGWVERVDMPKQYLESLLVVLPSLTPEPFGRGALEALSFGTPAVVSNRGGMGEIIEDGVTGLVVCPTAEDIAQAIITVIEKNGMFRKNIKENLGSLTAKFEIKPIDDYLKFYKQLV